MKQDIFNYDAVSLAQKLIRFDTTNGVNSEKNCIMFIKNILDEAGMETWLISNDEARPNLFAKLKAKNPGPNIPPFVMYGHIDVVPTEDQVWDKDPFAGIIEDGYLWGRGAIDMKGEHGMMLEALLKIIKETKEGKIDLPFDIYYIAVSDEEGTSDYGMKYLVENHHEQFEGMKYAIGEIGGFSLKIMGKKLYPIQIGEKQVAEIKITAKGEGGHASMKHSGTAMERLAEAIAKLSKERLPVRIAPSVRYMMEEMSRSFGGVIGFGIKLLLKPSLTDKLLALLGTAGNLFDPLLHNSLNVTVVGGGSAVNVIPSNVWCKCDLRMVPECTMDEAISDIKSLIGSDFEIEVLNYDEGMAGVDLKLYESMAAAIKKADPNGYPVPFVLQAVTDARFLARAGVQSYGFTPMDLPDDYDFTDLSHNANERVPVSALKFGAKVIYEYINDGYANNFIK
ncbi:MAG: M20/M25/M40 family metallo-hydrolase [Firmicutes bacterium]|nr:M20/M25/M40 family metallo-hydrolase [Bacillota bacterium]